MRSNRNDVPPMTPVTLTIYIITVILVGLYLYFIKGGVAGKSGAFIVCIPLILYLIFAYVKEQRDDARALEKKGNILDGEYFESSQWREKYIEYKKTHPFTRPKYPSMKKDLLKRFQRREHLFMLLFMLLLMGLSFFVIFTGKPSMGIVGVALFGFLFYIPFSDYIGMPVRKWLKGDINYKVLEDSYLKSEMLIYKKSGLAFGSTHLHAYSEKEIYAIDYKLVEGISRRVVRVKKYENNIYSSEEYEFYAVIHVLLPESGYVTEIDIELDEFQVQMAIDKLAVYKLGDRTLGDTSLVEKKYNEINA